MDMARPEYALPPRGVKEKTLCKGATTPAGTKEFERCLNQFGLIIYTYTGALVATWEDVPDNP
jgi:hypothetical protein